MSARGMMTSPTVGHEFTLHPLKPFSSALSSLKVAAGIRGVATGQYQFYWRITGISSSPYCAHSLTQRVYGLWERSICCEAFLKDPHSNAYLEFNLCPEGAWNVFSFSSYRVGMQEFSQGLQDFSSYWDANTLVLTSSWSDKTGFFSSAPECALSVIVREDAIPSYFALKHPVANPDFHHPASFIVVNV